jgi:hypothetical protein
MGVPRISELKDLTHSKFVEPTQENQSALNHAAIQQIQYNIFNPKGNIWI